MSTGTMNQNQGGHPTPRNERFSCFFISTMAPSSSCSPSLNVISLTLILFLFFFPPFFFFWKIISLQYLVVDPRYVADRQCHRFRVSSTRRNEKQRRIVRNIKVTKIRNHKWNHRLSLVARQRGGRTLRLEQYCRRYREKFDGCLDVRVFPTATHSHPFSLIMWASSMMNLPSLYFWLDSNACSYFHPRVVLQHSQ